MTENHLAGLSGGLKNSVRGRQECNIARPDPKPVQEAFGERQQQSEFKAYRLGMQVPCGLDTQVSEESVVWEVTICCGAYK
jgi:hypothetical protein